MGSIKKSLPDSDEYVSTLPIFLKSKTTDKEKSVCKLLVFVDDRELLKDSEQEMWKYKEATGGQKPYREND